MKKNDDLNNLIKFWDERFILTDEIKEEIKEYDKNKDYINLAPSQKLVDACKELAKYEKVLDYASGYDWASIIMAKNGCKEIVSADTSKNSKVLADYYSHYFEVNDYVNHLVINEDWLYNLENNSFNGIICSNLFDVIPVEITLKIIKEFSRIITKDGLVVIGLNYYLDINKIPKVENKPKNYLYLEGVLRLVSLTDEEWTDLFNEYFDIIKLEHFSWPGEEKETRRLFYLKKK